MDLPNIIALDGPAASGKSTLALRLAKELDYLFFDTGVMYRAITWAALQRGIELKDEQAVTQLAEQVQIDVRPATQSDSRTSDVLVDGQDVTWEIRHPDVEANVSIVAAYAGVRNALTQQQRRVGQRGKVVMVGRDIGTVVLPEADIKIYLDASVEQRALRRHNEIESRGQAVDYGDILESMRQRDLIDSTRKVAPLRPAEDALVLLSDGLSADQVLQVVLDWVRLGNGRSPVIQGHIDLVTVLVDDMPAMLGFYRDVLGFTPQVEQGEYTEFQHAGVRFALCTRQVMANFTQDKSLNTTHSGQSFELALLVAKPEEVDRAYAHVIARGGKPVTQPADMPWGQRTAFFADPEGNIHEIFANQ